MAFWIFSKSLAIAESTDSESRFTSSKHPTEPESIIPINIRDKLSLSIAESQLKTITGLPNLLLNAFTVSVLPVPAGPYGSADLLIASADTSVE